MTLEDTHQQLTPTQIQEFETEFNLKLPEDYKEFILQYNGGYPLENVFENEQEDEFDINSFFSIRNDFDVDSEGVMSSKYIIDTHQIIEQNIPNHLYPFGNTPGNQTYCISLAKYDYGSIYIYYLDGRKPEQTYVTFSFLNFIQNLKEDTEDY